MIFICFGIGVILVYVFNLKKIPLYKMQRKNEHAKSSYISEVEKAAEYYFQKAQLKAPDEYLESIRPLKVSKMISPIMHRNANNSEQ